MKSRARATAWMPMIAIASLAAQPSTTRSIDDLLNLKRVGSPAISPDRRWLAFLSDRDIKNAKTPTLIQHGDQDQRVPPPNAFELYQGLRDQNVAVQLVLFKGFGHPLNKPKANRGAMQQNFDWFNKYIWTNTGVTR